PSGALRVTRSGRVRYLHSFPTRRSSDLVAVTCIGVERHVEHNTDVETGPADRPGRPAHEVVRIERLSRILGAQSWIRIRKQCDGDRKSTRLNSSHVKISYAVFCLKKKKQ